VSSRREHLADIEARLESLGPTRSAASPTRAERRAPGTKKPARLPPGLALLPVRLFLGITFTYAGAQKLSDPGFLHPGAPTYIGTQLHQFARGTPGGFILRLLALPDPGLAGVGVALVEIAVGLLAFFGLVTRAAALMGLALNLLLFLTNSWNTYPYFLGSDIVFVFAWLPFVLTGASGQPALDHVVEDLVQRWRPRSAHGAMPMARPRGPTRTVPRTEDEVVTRRALVARGLGATALLTGIIAGIAALAKGSYHGGAAAATLTAPKGHRQPIARHRARAQPGSRSAGLPPGARDLGAASQLPPGHAAYYRDPVDGAPDIVVRQADGKLSAHSAICTHAGCTVGYSGTQLVCPCHGSVFDAASGAVLQGPAVTPLPARRVVENGGQLFAVPT
jgi:thiosulfate dehydrogenase [quinone] large subunit